MISFTVGCFTGALIGLSGYTVGYLQSKHLLKNKINSLQLTIKNQDDVLKKKSQVRNEQSNCTSKKLPPIQKQVPTKPKKLNNKIVLPFYVDKFIKFEKKSDNDLPQIISDVFGSPLLGIWNDYDKDFNFSDVVSWIKLPNNTEKFVKALLYGNYEVEKE